MSSSESEDTSYSEQSSDEEDEDTIDACNECGVMFDDIMDGDVVLCADTDCDAMYCSKCAPDNGTWVECRHDDVWCCWNCIEEAIAQEPGSLDCKNEGCKCGNKPFSLDA